jgi:hypothetical protein
MDWNEWYWGHCWMVSLEWILEPSCSRCLGLWVRVGHREVRGSSDGVLVGDGARGVAKGCGGLGLLVELVVLFP